MVVLSVATVAVVAAVACPGGVVGVALGWRPLRWIGARSYGSVAATAGTAGVLVIATPPGTSCGPGSRAAG